MHRIYSKRWRTNQSFPEEKMTFTIFLLSCRAGIPAVNKNGDLLLLYVGIIDILQNYRLRKKLEHAFKSTLVTRVRIDMHREKIMFYMNVFLLGRNICL